MNNPIKNSKNKIRKIKVSNENNTSITKANNKDFFIDSVISSIDKVNPSDWEHFFDNKALRDVVPCNPLSNSIYKGVNSFYLLLVQMVFKFESNKFSTFNQISEAGGKVKKGAKSFPVEYYNFFAINKDSGEKLKFEDYKKLSKGEKENYILRFFNKTYPVFNFDQTENLDIESFDLINEFQPIENIEAFLNEAIGNHSIDIRYECTNEAYFMPLTDSITLPERDFFVSPEAFYSTTFHELIHWTGTEPRLNRDMTGFFGNEKYAFEELVAELGSMIILNDFQIFSKFNNSLAYLKGWLKSTQSKDKEIELRKAFSESKRAYNFLKTEN